MSNLNQQEYRGKIEEIENELYTALQALEKGDLCFVHSSASRARSYTQNLWRLIRTPQEENKNAK